ncbi:MAG TPA: histidine phosphatase family protein [Gaiellaceae bacterium]|nr:histidine phosphatase family protein [Gaiellaceae bacterium]
MDAKTLYLLRHAKSSWDEAGLADRDRPLAPRGRKAARRIAKHLRDHEIAPAIVLCSSALRARQTLDAILPALAGEPEVLIEDALYAAGADSLLARLRAVPETVPSVLLIGHNPGIGDLAFMLAGGGDGAALQRLREGFPTGALATLEIAEAGWSGLGDGSASLTGYVVPRELA